MANELTWQSAADNLWSMRDEIWKAFWETLIMVGVSTLASVIFGTLLGVALFMTSKNQLSTNPTMYRILDSITNLMRAFPFVILMIVLIPVTRAIVGTSIGALAASFVLSISGLFYFARLVEQNLRDVPRGIIEAAQSMGASKWTIIRKVLLVESRSSMILSIAVLCISLLSYSAAAGLIGAGGLGDLALRYGHYRYQKDVMYFMVVLLVLLVIIIQSLGNFFAHKLDKR